MTESSPVEQEQVVMTPKGKTANSTTIMIERKLVQKASEKMHVAGGEHTGIIINKETALGKALKVSFPGLFKSFSFFQAMGKSAFQLNCRLSLRCF